MDARFVDFAIDVLLFSLLHCKPASVTTARSECSEEERKLWTAVGNGGMSKPKDWIDGVMQ